MSIKNLAFYILSVTAIFSTSSCIKSPDTSSDPLSSNNRESGQHYTDHKGDSDVKAIIKTVHGNIVFKFYPKHAPNTVTRIIELIRSGFYDGLTFHRVVPNFVIQGGDPTGTGSGGSGVKLKSEFNSLQHTKGTVAMARSVDKDSADSQFYIALSTLPDLDGKYTIFGQLTEGMTVLDKIRKNDKILSMAIIDNENEKKD